MERTPSSAVPGDRRFRARPSPGVLVVVCGLLACLAHAAEPRVSAVIQPATIPLGESAQLSIQFDNCQPAARPQIAGLEGLDIAYTGSSTHVSIVNGQQTVSLRLAYALRPTRPGEFQIPALTIPISGKNYATEPVRLRVLRPNEAAPATATNQLAFLRLETPKDEVYVGEVLPVEILLYYLRAQDIQIPPLTAAGFTLGKLIQLPAAEAVVDRQRYRVVGLRTTAQAAKEGALTLGPAECQLNLLISSARRRGANPLFDNFFDDPFFDDPFGGRDERRPVRLVSEAKTIRAIPLPEENVPPSFAGAVGRFTFEVSASPTNAAVGEPVNLTLRVSGRGVLENIRLPQLQTWNGFKAYPPTSDVETTDQFGVEGTRTFRQVIVPESIDVREVPPLIFAFFDPEARQYRSLTNPAIPLLVRPVSGPVVITPAAPASATDSPGSAPALNDIVGQKTRPGVLGSLSPPLLRRDGFLTLQLLPAALFLGVFGWRKWTEHLARNPHLVRRQQVQRLVRRGQQELHELAAAGDGAQFHATVFRLLQEQIGERLGRPALSITESVIDEQLEPRGVTTETRRLLHELFTACNHARYAPSVSARDLKSQIPRIDSALQALRQLPDP